MPGRGAIAARTGLHLGRRDDFRLRRRLESAAATGSGSGAGSGGARRGEVSACAIQDSFSIGAPSCSAGCCQTKASSRPVAGEIGAHFEAAIPSAIQTGIARRAGAAGEPFAHLAFVAGVAVFEFGHDQAHALRRAFILADQRRHRRARGGEIARRQRGAGDDDVAFRIARADFRQRARLGETVGIGIARPQIEIDIGEIGMRLAVPRRLDDLWRLCAIRRGGRGSAPSRHWRG